MLTDSEQRMVAMWMSGATWVQMAEGLGIHIRTLARWMNRPHVQAELTRLREQRCQQAQGLLDEVVRDSAEKIRKAQQKIVDALEAGVDVVVTIMMDSREDAYARLRAFQLLADRGGLIPGKTVQVVDKYEGMPIEELEREVQSILEQRRRTG